MNLFNVDVLCYKILNVLIATITKQHCQKNINIYILDPEETTNEMIKWVEKTDWKMHPYIICWKCRKQHQFKGYQISLYIYVNKWIYFNYSFNISKILNFHVTLYDASL